MQVLFCHDGPLKIDEDNDYFGSAHNDKTFRRYYTIGEELSVAIRVQNVNKLDATSKLSKITVTPFSVVHLPNISSARGVLQNRKRAKNILESKILESDFVIARIPSSIGFMAIELAKEKNKPYLVELVTCAWDSYWNHSFKGKIVAPYMYLKTKKQVKHSEFTVYVTNDFLQKRYPTNGLSTNCSNVALNDINQSTIENRLIKIGNLNSNKIILGTTAAVDVKFKGQQYIIEALGNLKKKGKKNYEYQLVGGGDTKYLMKIAEKNGVSDQIVFLGSMPHSKVFEWLNTIDLYVQPSRQEGLPRALIEAMSQGLPAFGARTAGIPELLEPQYIFSNTNENIKEICRILEAFSKEEMKYAATKNFEEAKNYRKEIIESRRQEFFKKFKNNSILLKRD